jgi:xanthine dehydrogenase accessory factor
MDRTLLQALNAARRERRAVLVRTRLDTGEQALVADAEAVPEGTLRAAVAEAFRTGKSRSIETEQGPVFLAPYLPPPRLVMIGAVHISQALAPMARMAGFDPLVIDPRTAFATPERFPDVPVVAEWPQDALPRVGLDRFTALACLTHDPKIDDPALQAGLAAGCFYVGALGSRKTHARRVERLAAAGIAPAEIGRIHAPIGLEIGAATPAEIALATLAQIVAVLRRRAGEAA